MVVAMEEAVEMVEVPEAAVVMEVEEAVEAGEEEINKRLILCTVLLVQTKILEVKIDWDRDTIMEIG